MKRKKSLLHWLASTSVLLTASLAHAAPANTRAVTDTANPGMITPGHYLPEGTDVRGCPRVPVTAQDCRAMVPASDAGPAQPCFLEQLHERGSYCAELLTDEAALLAEDRTRVNVLSPQGMDGGLREALAVPPIANFIPGKPDPASYTSLRNEQLRRLADRRVTDEDEELLTEWNDNGVSINSCREYVYEKYYEYSRFQEETAKRALEYRDYFNIAFEHASRPWAIGSRHLDPNDPLRYRSKDGVTLSQGADIFQSRRHFIPIDIAEVTLDIPDFIKERSDVASVLRLIEKAKANRDPAHRDRVENMQWHQRMSEELKQARRHKPARLIAHDSIASVGPEQWVNRGYVDEELNAIYPRIRQLEYLLYFFHQVSNDKTCGTAGVVERAWTIEDPRWRIDPWENAIRPPDSYASSRLQAIQPQVIDLIDSQFAVVQGAWAYGSASEVARDCAARWGNWVISNIEYMPQLAEDLEYLDGLGCLEPGITACDWSPAAFAMDLSTMASREQEIDFKLCVQRVANANDFTRGPEDEKQFDSLCPMNGLVPCGPLTHRAFPTAHVDIYDKELCVSPYDSQCAVTLTVSSTADCKKCQNDPMDDPACGRCWEEKAKLLRQVEDQCNDNEYDEDGKRINFTASPAAFETFYDHLDQWTPSVRFCQYMKAVANIGRRAPQLIAEGQIRQPGFRTSHSEIIGASYFGVEYGWEASTMVSDLTKVQDTCGINLEANTEFHIKSRVLWEEEELMQARIDTATGAIYARIKDMEAYSPQPLGGESYDLVMDPMRTTKDVASSGFDVWINILGIPLHVTGGVTGTVGIKGHAQVYRAPECRKSSKVSTGDVGNVNKSLNVELRPFANLSGYAVATVSAVVAEAGIKGSLLVLDASLPITVQQSLKTQEYKGVGADSTQTESNFATLSDASVELKAMSGAIDAFVQFGICPFCDDAQMRIVSWEGPKWRKSLSHEEYNVAAEDLLTVFNPAYEQ